MRLSQIISMPAKTKRPGWKKKNRYKQWPKSKEIEVPESFKKYAEAIQEALRLEDERAKRAAKLRKALTKPL